MEAQADISICRVLVTSKKGRRAGDNSGLCDLVATEIQRGNVNRVQTTACKTKQSNSFSDLFNQRRMFFFGVIHQSHDLTGMGWLVGVKRTIAIAAYQYSLDLLFFAL